MQTSHLSVLSGSAVQAGIGHRHHRHQVRGQRQACICAAEVRIFSAKNYETPRFEAANNEHQHGFTLLPVDVPLNSDTVGLAESAEVVCAFVNDDLNAEVIKALADSGTKCIAMRCAGYNNVDLAAAQKHGIPVVTVPAYSPQAIAEHTLALILALNRNIHRAYPRVRDRNFALHGLVGFNMAGKTAGVIGTGRIGTILARLLWHLRCKVLAVDMYENEDLKQLGVTYVELDELLANSDIISLNCPLLDSTKHIIGGNNMEKLKDGVMIVNTGRGALVDTAQAVQALKTGKIGSMALDVYEEESGLFFEDRSDDIIQDDVFARLLTFPNVLVTSHQAFLTHEALTAIAETTLSNAADIMSGRECSNVIHQA